MRESDILYSNPPAWVFGDRKKKAYVVMVDGNVVSTSDSAYALTADGLSIAKARCDYIAKRTKDSNNRIDSIANFKQK